MDTFFDLFLSPSAANLDIERILSADKLLHLHPHWFIDATSREERGISATIRDYDTDKESSFIVNMSCTSAPDDPPDSKPFLRISLFESGVSELLFFATRENTQVRLRCPGELDPALEQDMLLWVRAIQEYLRLYIATTPRTLFFRLLMNRMVLQMNPSQRKICLMIAKITVVELVVIVVIVIGYVFFGQ